MTFETFFTDFWPVFLAFLAAALLLGIFYNQFVAWLKRHGYDEGYVWLEVVIGVGLTLLLLAGLLLATGQGLLPVFLVFALFCMTGLPMAAGDIARYVAARKAETER